MDSRDMSRQTQQVLSGVSFLDTSGLSPDESRKLSGILGVPLPEQQSLVDDDRDAVVQYADSQMPAKTESPIQFGSESMLPLELSTDELVQNQTGIPSAQTLIFQKSPHILIPPGQNVNAAAFVPRVQVYTGDPISEPVSQSATNGMVPTQAEDISEQKGVSSIILQPLTKNTVSPGSMQVSNNVMDMTRASHVHHNGGNLSIGSSAKLPDQKLTACPSDKTLTSSTQNRSVEASNTINNVDAEGLTAAQQTACVAVTSLASGAVPRPVQNISNAHPKSPDSKNTQGAIPPSMSSKGVNNGVVSGLNSGEDSDQPLVVCGMDTATSDNSEKARTNKGTLHQFPQPITSNSALVSGIGAAGTDGPPKTDPDTAKDVAAQSFPKSSTAAALPTSLSNNRSVSVQSQPADASSIVSEAPAQTPPKMSWANLFKDSNSPSTPATVIYREETVKPSSVSQAVASPERSVVSAKEDAIGFKLGAFVKNYKVNHTGVLLMPRGMTNHNNGCYINATLQAIIAPPQAYHLFKDMGNLMKGCKREESSTPICDALISFVDEFTVLERQGSSRRGKRSELVVGPPIDPIYISTLLMTDRFKAFQKGRQEDAHEFLSALLVGSEEEYLAHLKHTANENGTEHLNGFLERDERSPEVSEADGVAYPWMEVGPHNRIIQANNRTRLQKTPIKQIFGGSVLNLIQKDGTQLRTSIEEHIMLTLDIQHVKTLQEALQSFTAWQSVESSSDPDSGDTGELSTRTLLEELPQVLILHLKTFLYDHQTEVSKKIITDFKFDVDLQITKDMLSSNARSRILPAQRTYKLCSVVFHHGPKATGGHYTAVTFDLAANGWFLKDDTSVKAISESQFLQYNTDNLSKQMPYFLVYRQRTTCSNGTET